MKNEAENRRIDHLNELLLTEFEAVEAYDWCLDHVSDDIVAPQLRVLRMSHVHRMELIAGRLQALGEAPRWKAATEGEPFGKLELHQEASVERFVASLRSCEDECLKRYREGVAELDVGGRRFVRDALLPEQQRTCVALEGIGKAIH